MNHKKPTETQKRRLGLTLMYSGVTFVFFLATMLIVGIAMAVLVHHGVLVPGPVTPSVNRIIWGMVLASIVIGTLMAFLASRIPLRPINQLINAMNRLARGDYRARLKYDSFFGRYATGREISASFNKLAEELEGTEMLRSDFINNFSHEFKTPIVSIAGFAALLKRGNLSEAQKREYIDVIEEESLRLSAMATNVLNLTKVENQNILTNTSRFNLSEQVRSCVLLLERKWTQKRLELELDFDEHFITANEEQLKQVWINLIDNAVKFTPEYGLVRIDITEGDETMVVSVANTGSTIPEAARERIFQKFYQADESHATQGNGVGLAIVKKVVELHGGAIQVTSESDLTTFVVTLPIE